MGSHESRAGEQNLFSDPPGNTALSATQDTADFMDCKCTLLSHIHYLIHQYPQVLLHRVAFNPLIAHSIFVPVIFPVRCRTLNLVLLPFMMFFMGPPLKCVLILLHSTPSLQPAGCTPELHITHKLSKLVLNASMHVADEDSKQHLSELQPLRNATCHCSPLRPWVTDHSPLSATFSQFLFHRVVPLSDPHLSSLEMKRLC